MTKHQIGNFAFRLVLKGQLYGLNGAFVHGGSEPLVEVYTLKDFFISRYYLDTFLGARGGLCLDGGTPEWSLNVFELRAAQRWARFEAARSRALSDAAKAAAILAFTYGVADYDAALKLFNLIQFDGAVDVGEVLEAHGAGVWESLQHLPEGAWWDEVTTLARSIDLAQAHFGV